jgi:FG-GAP repeat/IPT/TIG domain
MNRHLLITFLACALGALPVVAGPGDPLAQEASLRASNPGYINNFGDAVAVDGDTAVVGAKNEDSSATGINGSQSNGITTYGSGAVYVFVRSNGEWTQQAYIKASNTEGNDNFGASVALSGDTLVVGAPGEDSTATGINGIQTDNSSSNSGAVYVFTRTAGVWSQQSYIKPTNTGPGDAFGTSVAISGDSLIVGAPYEAGSATGVGGNDLDNNASNAGAAYVFKRNAGAWSQQAYLKASNTGSNDSFGLAVAIDDDTAVVGARGEASNATGVNAPVSGGSGSQADNSAGWAGAAYVFKRIAGVWTQQAYLKAGNSGPSDQFGYSVAVDQDTVVVAAVGEASNATGVNAPTSGGSGTQADNSATGAGAAYVFTRSGTTWTQQAYLKAVNSEASDTFGTAVAISGDTVVVGAIGEDSNATGVDGDAANNSAAWSGAAYVFLRSSGAWSQQAYLKAQDTAANDFFGTAVAVSWDTAIIGADNKLGDPLVPSTYAEGAAYVFTPPPPAPQVVGIAPASGDVAGGTPVTITGAYFSGTTGVTIGGAPATTVSVVNDTTITAVTPPGTAGSASVVVTSPAGSNAANSFFTYFIPAPDIAVVGGSALTDGDTLTLATIGGPAAPLTFTITNPGTGELNGLVINKTGPDAEDFLVGNLSATSIPAGGGSATFTVTFSPNSGSAKSAVIEITSNLTGAKNPFEINLAGQTLLVTEDTDSDGLNDVAEYQMAALGFDFQVAQPSLVETYFATANGAGLLKASQVQALKLPTPQIQRNPLTGEFTLGFGLEKSATLEPAAFGPFPITAPQVSVVGGKLEIRFPGQGDAAFFRLSTQ